MENQEELLNQLGQIIQEKGLQPGDRLPAERKLAREMLISRNTLRNFLRMLEGRGLVHTKNKSGTYLRARLMESKNGNTEIKTRVNYPIADQLEAAFLFLPLLMERALYRISDRQIQKVQECNIALGQSIYSMDASGIMTEVFNFFRIIALATNNEYLIQTAEQLCFFDLFSFEHLFEMEQEIREKIFAGHVDILQALRESNALDIGRITERYILTWCDILQRHAGISMSAFMSRQISQKE